MWVGCWMVDMRWYWYGYWCDVMWCEMILMCLVRRQYLQIISPDFIHRPSHHRCTCAKDNVFRAMPFMASMAFASLLSWAKLCLVMTLDDFGDVFVGWLLDDVGWCLMILAWVLMILGWCLKIILRWVVMMLYDHNNVFLTPCPQKFPRCSKFVDLGCRWRCKLEIGWDCTFSVGSSMNNQV